MIKLVAMSLLILCIITALYFKFNELDPESDDKFKNKEII